MKKITVLLLTAILLVSTVFMFVACDNDGTDDRETLVVGMECAYEPYNWSQPNASNGAVRIDGTNLYANGYDVKIAKFIAAALDRQLVIKGMDWDALIPAVTAGTIDLIVAGMSPTDERKQAIDFTVNYFTSELVVVVRKDSPLASATDLSSFANKNIVAQRDTVHEQVLVQITGIPTQVENGVTVPTNTYRYEDFTTMRTALSAGIIDGYVAEEPGAIADCNANSNFVYIHLENNVTGFTVESEDDVSIAVGVKKGSSLVEQINGILAGLSDEMRLQLMTNAIEQCPSL